MRLIGLDYGSKTIGIALSDPLGITAHGLETIIRRSRELDFKRIEEIIAYYRVDAVIIGLPKNMDGSRGLSARKSESFARRLKQKINLPVYLWDERLTTVAAEKVLIEADISRRKRKLLIDKQAAQLILQSYLDYKGMNKIPSEEN